MASVGLVVAAGPATAATITSSGPLTSITVSPDLNCAVNHVQDSAGEFYGDTACGTFLAVEGVVYGPESVPAGSGVPIGFTPISQTSSGTGTASDPYLIETVVSAGSTGVQISQTDSYVVGQESYRTDTTVMNTSAAAVDAVVYKAGDCYLQDSDDGYGEYTPATGAISCVGVEYDPDTGDPSPGNRIEQFYPLSAGSAYYQADYSSVWDAIDTGEPFPNSCACGVLQDNGAGLSWDFTLSAGASATRSHLTTFSPLGVEPLRTSKTADSATSPAGGSNGYTITVQNPNGSSMTLSSVLDTLPLGFAYVTGSTTGATTADPVASGQELAWTGPFQVAAGDDLAIHFDVTVADSPGTYYNNAGATSDSVAVAPTGDTAPVTVTSESSNAPPTADAGGPYIGTEGSDTALLGTASDPDSDPLTYTWSSTAGIGVDAGASCSFADAGVLATTVTCTDDGTYELTLSVVDGQNPAVSSSALLTVGNEPPEVSITSPADMSQLLVGNTANVTAGLSDPGSNDTHTCEIDWGDGSSTSGTVTSGVCTGSHVYSGTGVYDVRVTATDDDGASGWDMISLVVHDSATKVTGGGFVVADGRVSFGFVAKQDGVQPVGQIQVRLHGPDRSRFHGSTVDSLSSDGASATWTGHGRWNGLDGYAFEVTVLDGGKGPKKRVSPDSIDLRITAPDGSTVLHVVGSLKGGNITVH